MTFESVQTGGVECRCAIGFGGAIFAEQQLGMWVELSAARFCLLSVLGTGRPRFYSAIRASHKSPLEALRYG